MANVVGSKSPKAQRRRANKLELDSILLQLKSISQIVTLDMDEDTATEIGTTLDDCSRKLIKIAIWIRKRSSFSGSNVEEKRTREVIDITTISPTIPVSVETGEYSFSEKDKLENLDDDDSEKVDNV